MKKDKYILIPQTGGERDAINIFKSTIEIAASKWVYDGVTAMSGDGSRVLRHTISKEVFEALEKMYEEIDEETIGDGLHWRDGESVMKYFTVE